MHCAACAQNVERALRGVSGVVEARVNFADDSASVSYAPAATEVAALVAAVREAGYDAVVAGGGEEVAQLREEETRRQGALFVLGLALSVPIMALAMSVPGATSPRRWAT